jgi:phage terminase large subunit-like protein
MLQIAKLPALKARARRQGWIRYIRSEADERAMLEGCRFDIARAERVQEFCGEFLCHSQGDYAGKPVIFEAWQRDDIIFPMFGWVRPNGRRRFRKSYIEIPKKNGKSFMCSALGLYFLCGDGEPGAKVFAAATAKDQARIVHEEAQAMVLASPALCSELQVLKSRSLIKFAPGNSEFKALSSDSPNLDGLNAHAVIADELHRWQGNKLYNVLRYAFSARSQPMFLIITTAGDDQESVCYQEHKRARAILDGTLWETSYLPYIRTVSDPNCSILDERSWYEANPNLGISIPIDGYRAEAREAAANPVDEANFRRLKLNIWTAAGTKWMDPAEWKQCEEPFSLEDLRGRECYAGLDMSRTTDTTAIVLVFPMENGHVRLLSVFFLPEETAKRQKDKISWHAWADAGAIELVPGRVISYKTVIDKFRELAGLFQIKQVAFDPAFADNVTETVEMELGIERFEFRQSIENFTPAVDEFDRRVLERTLQHNGNPVLNWEILNTLVKSVGILKRPVRTSKDDLYKIDGTVAALMALRLYMETYGSTGDYQIREI